MLVFLDVVFPPYDSRGSVNFFGGVSGNHENVEIERIDENDENDENLNMIVKKYWLLFKLLKSSKNCPIFEPFPPIFFRPFNFSPPCRWPGTFYLIKKILKKIQNFEAFFLRFLRLIMSF